MEKRKKKLFKRYVTLIEMMIVMFLIALITGVVAYNYRGTLDEGKAFKTKAGIEKLGTILNLAVAEDADLMSSITSSWEGIVDSSPLVQNSAALKKDGWGQTYVVTVNSNTQAIEVTSARYNDYISKGKTMFSNRRD